MVFFSILMWWAYSPNEYNIPGAKKTSIWRPLWDSINYGNLLNMDKNIHHLISEIIFSRLRRRNFWLVSVLCRLHPWQAFCTRVRPPEINRTGRQAQNEFRAGIWRIFSDIIANTYNRCGGKS